MKLVRAACGPVWVPGPGTLRWVGTGRHDGGSGNAASGRDVKVAVIAAGRAYTTERVDLSAARLAAVGGSGPENLAASRLVGPDRGTPS